MKKHSMMGGGEFEFQPEKLQKKIDKRQKYFADKHEEYKTMLLNDALEYQKQGLGTFENYIKDSLYKLVLVSKEMI